MVKPPGRFSIRDDESVDDFVDDPPHLLRLSAAGAFVFAILLPFLIVLFLIVAQCVAS